MGYRKKDIYRYFSIVSWRCFANRAAWNIPKSSNSSAKNPRTFVAIVTVFASIHKQTHSLSNIVQIVSYRFENIWNRARKQLSHYFSIPRPYWFHDFGALEVKLRKLKMASILMGDIVLSSVLLDQWLRHKGLAQCMAMIYIWNNISIQL